VRAPALARNCWHLKYRVPKRRVMADRADL
jgi:hypothetical protein